MTAPVDEAGSSGHLAAAILRVVGVIELGPNRQVERRLFRDAGFREQRVGGDKLRMFRGMFYPEFVGVMFPGEEARNLDYPAEVLARRLDLAVEVEGRLGGNTVRFPCRLTAAEAMLFTEPPLGIFAVEVEVMPGASLEWLAAAIPLLRAFSSRVLEPGEAAAPQQLINFLHVRVLGRPPPRVEKPGRGEIEEYCGGKYKVFCVADLARELPPAARRELLYDLGCAAPLGSAAARLAVEPGPLAPSEEYYQQLMRGAVSAFRNYDALPLVDSFTVAGRGLLATEIQRATWRETYFRIYVFNLFLKFSLHFYAAKLREEARVSPVELRDRFETFLRFYDVARISFNFLPEMLHHSIRSALDLETELERLRARITRLSNRIGETQTVRTNRLLGLISWIGSLAGVGVIWAKMEDLRAELGWPRIVFFSLALMLTAGASLAAFAYVFPEQRRLVQARVRTFTRRPEQVTRRLRLWRAVRRARRVRPEGERP
jgi:hypothetical protein